MTTVDSNTSACSLAAFWQHFDSTTPPYTHPLDREIVLKLPHRVYSTTEDYVSSEDFGNPGSLLQLGLLPVPYAGDLAKADIFILLLNPGFDTVDIYGENDVSDFREATTRMLNQDLANEEFPFIFLNPKFCWSGGYRWWERKLHDVAATYANTKGVSYLEALRVVSQHLVAIELIPYHSASSPPGAVRKAPSAIEAQRFVKEVILPRARLGQVTVIVTRQAATWGLTASKGEPGIVVYDGGHARGASLSTNSAGGQAILRRLAS